MAEGDACSESKCTVRQTPTQLWMRLSPSPGFNGYSEDMALHGFTEVQLVKQMRESAPKVREQLQPCYIVEPRIRDSGSTH